MNLSLEEFKGMKRFEVKDHFVKRVAKFVKEMGRFETFDDEEVDFFVGKILKKVKTQGEFRCGYKCPFFLASKEELEYYQKKEGTFEKNPKEDCKERNGKKATETIKEEGKGKTEVKEKKKEEEVKEKKEEKVKDEKKTNENNSILVDQNKSES